MSERKADTLRLVKIDRGREIVTRTWADGSRDVHCDPCDERITSDRGNSNAATDAAIRQHLASAKHLALSPPPPPPCSHCGGTGLAT